MIDAQELDSLMEVLADVPSEKTAIQTKNKIGNHYRLSNKGDSAIFWLNKALEESRNAENNYWIAKNLSDLGETAFRPMGDFQQALIYVEEAIPFSIKSGDSLLLAANYFSLGRIFADQGNYTKSLESLYQSLGLYETNKDSMYYAKVYNSLGIVYSRQENYQNALRFYQLSLQYSRLLKKNINAAFSSNNIGTTFQRMNLQDSAVLYFREGLKIEKNNPYPFARAALLNNLGNSFRFLEAFDSSVYYHRQSLAIGRELGSRSQIAWCELGLGYVYLAMNNPQQAVNHAQISLELSIKGKENELSKQSSEILHQAYADLGNHVEAYDNLLLFKAFSDSLSDTKNIRRQAQIEYEVEKKKVEDIAQLELKAQEESYRAQIEQERKFRDLIVGALVIAAMLLLVIWKSSRRTKKVNSILKERNHLIHEQSVHLEELNKSKDKYFALISHDLRGPMSVFHGMAYVIKHSIESKQFDDLSYLADKMDESATNVSRLLDNLLNWALQQQKNLPFCKEEFVLEITLNETIELYKTLVEAKAIKLKSTCDANIKIYADRNGISTIMRNLVNNAIKFTESGGEIAISAVQHGSEIEICVKDTGIGMSEKQVSSLLRKMNPSTSFGTDGERGVGLGSQLILDFVKMHDGRLEIQSELGVGSQFNVFFPKKTL